MTDRAAIVAETEARIVAWLYAQQSKWLRMAHNSDIEGNSEIGYLQNAVSMNYARCAQAIERGDHHQRKDGR